MKKLLFLAAITFMATACGSGDDGTPPSTNTIEVTEGQTDQTTYADETEGTSGVTFVAPEPWTASINETTTRASDVSWLRLKVNGEEVYSGGAGTITLAIEMDENDTAQDRKATITISSGGADLEINVSQKAKTVAEAIEDGSYDPVVRPEPVSGKVWKIVMTNSNSSESLTFNWDETNKDFEVSGSFTLKNADGTDETWKTALNARNPGGLWTAATTIDFPNLTRKEVHRYYYIERNGVYRTTEQTQGSDFEIVKTWSYDSDGGLAAILNPLPDGTMHKQNIIWESGNPVKFENYSISYGNVNNNPRCNIDLNHVIFSYITSGGQIIDHIMFGIGIFGKRSAKMASAFTYQDASGGYAGANPDLTYTVNDAGYITKIVVSNEQGDDTTVTILYK